MATAKKTQKPVDRKKQDAQDTRKAKARFIDQPGQWEDTTPASVRKRQQKEWKKFEAMMAKKK